MPTIDRVNADTEKARADIRQSRAKLDRLEAELLRRLVGGVDDETAEQMVASVRRSSSTFAWQGIVNRARGLGAVIPAAIERELRAADVRRDGLRFGMSAILSPPPPSPTEIDDPESIGAEMEEIFRRAWGAHGERTFRFEAGMYSALRDTDLPADLICAELQLPFQCVRFEFIRDDNCILRFWLHQDPDGVIFVGSLSGDGLVVKVTDATWRFLILAADTGLRVADALPAMMEQVFPGTPRNRAAEGVGAVLNAILYLSSPRAVTEPYDLDAQLVLLRQRLGRIKARRKRERVERQIAKAQLRVGEIIVRRPVQRLPDIGETSGHLTYQFRVRGHWRNQAHGPRRSLRRRRWIEPYWRGPDTAEVLLRDYSVPTP